MTKFNRRTFLASGIAAGAAAAAPAHASVCPSVPQKWDETLDVVVIGSGFAGLAAAIEAHKAGASVAVFEKMPTPGGNSIINGGIMSVPGNPAQKKLGVEDSAELLAEDMLREGQGLNYPDKVKTVAEGAYGAWQWLEKELGVEFMEGRVGQEGGHSVPRHLYTKNGSGSGIVLKELDWLKKAGVPVRLRCYVETIWRDDTGRAVGVRVREGYKFPDKDSGKVKDIRARRAIVLCYGGFGADVKFRMKYDPKLTEKFDTTNQPGATGELWRETARIGCSQIQQDWIQCGPWNSPEEKGMGIALYFAQGAAASRGLWIDCKTGRRFVNELANRKVRADAVINNNNRGHKCIALADTNAVDDWQVARPGMLKKELERGVVHRCDSLEELSSKLGIPLDALKKSIADYNAVRSRAEADKTVRDEMGRGVYPKARPMEAAPWYYSFLSPKVHHCMGGLETNAKGQVIGITDDQPIPGLFAAGEATGGVHGAVRLGSCATLDCIVNGRIAGQNAAKA
jgi:flavocytochrome c